MKKKHMMVLAVLVFSVINIQTALAKRPPNNNDTDDSAIFRSGVTGMLTSQEKVDGEFEDGSFYTRPDQGIADSKNVGFSGNGSNEFKMRVDVAFLHGLLADENATTCFPTDVYAGSMQIYDYSSSRKDTNLVARYWFNANDGNGELIQYVIEFENDGAPGGWQNCATRSAADFLPLLGDPVICREASSLQIRATSKKSKSACVTDGWVDLGYDLLQVDLERIDECHYPYDEVDCS